VYAAYNHYAGEVEFPHKDIRVWEYNHHEGGGTAHDQEKLAYLAAIWGN
jgi:cephalosporin-C deacetylase